MQEILPQLLINTLITGSIYCLVASGMAMTYGVMRILNFAHGHMMMLGAYIFYLSRYELGLNLLLCILINCLAVSAIAYLANYTFIRSFLRYDSYLPFITTLALANILEAIIGLVFGVDVKSMPLESFSQSQQYQNIFITPLQITLITISLSLIITLAMFISFSTWGKKIKAISESPYSAQAIGLNSDLITSSVFIVSSLLASTAGILVGYDTNLHPTIGKLYTLKAMAAMVLGGLGNLWGTLFGAFIIALIENISSGVDFGDFSLPAGYKDAFSFSIILLILLLKPSGLFSFGTRKV